MGGEWGLNRWGVGEVKVGSGENMVGERDERGG